MKVYNKAVKGSKVLKSSWFNAGETQVVVPVNKHMVDVVKAYLMRYWNNPLNFDEVEYYAKLLALVVDAYNTANPEAPVYSEVIDTVMNASGYEGYEVPPSGALIDHVNSYGWDNRVDNLVQVVGRNFRSTLL